MIGSKIRSVNQYSGGSLNRWISIPPTQNRCACSCWATPGFSYEYIEQFTQCLNWEHYSLYRQSLNQFERPVSHGRPIGGLRIG